MAQVLSLISSKGGVGKSTVTVNLSAALGDMGLKVLVVDLDSQQSVTKFYKYSQQPIGGLLEFITAGNVDVIAKTHFDNVDIVVNNDLTEELNRWMDEQFSGNFALKKVLTKVRDRYDIIIVDTQGKDGRGQLQEMALVASDIVITPTTPDVMSSQELPRSIKIYNQVVNGLADMLGQTQPPQLKILINQEDNTIETKKITHAIRSQFGEIARHVTVLKTAIPSRVVYKRCISEQIPAHCIENKVTESRRDALSIFESLVHEILPHYSDLSLTQSTTATGGRDE